jgi:hypothetical protein
LGGRRRRGGINIQQRRRDQEVVGASGSFPPLLLLRLYFFVMYRKFSDRTPCVYNEWLHSLLLLPPKSFFQVTQLFKRSRKYTKDRHKQQQPPPQQKMIVSLTADIRSGYHSWLSSGEDSKIVCLFYKRSLLTLSFPLRPIA